MFAYDEMSYVSKQEAAAPLTAVTVDCFALVSLVSDGKTPSVAPVTCPKYLLPLSILISFNSKK